MKIIVLGGGLIGGPMAMDLAADSNFEVSVADRDEETLQPLVASGSIEGIGVDLSQPEMVKKVVADFDLDRKSVV